jgi:hypothetical protein
VHPGGVQNLTAFELRSDHSDTLLRRHFMRGTVNVHNHDRSPRPRLCAFARMTWAYLSRQYHEGSGVILSFASLDTPQKTTSTTLPTGGSLTFFKCMHKWSYFDMLRRVQTGSPGDQRKCSSLCSDERAGRAPSSQ